jgi:hypothetical protein
MIKLTMRSVVNRPLPAALLEMDIDENAERYLVLDRRSLIPIYAGIRSVNGTTKIVLEQVFATAQHCLVGILDDDVQYNAKFIDGVQC